MSSLPAGRSLLLVVGLALVLASATPAVTGGSVLPSEPLAADSDPVNNPVPPSIAQPNGTTNYLQVPDDEVRTSGIERATANVPATTRVGTDSLEIQLAIETFRTRFENADNETERTAAVREIVRTLDRRAEALRQRQQTAIERYNAGEISGKQFLGTLVRVDATAEAIENAANAVTTADAETLGYSIPPALESRLRTYQGKLLPVSGQIRQYVLRPAVTGGDRSPPVYLETGDDDIVLVTIVGDRYAREAFSGEAFDPNGPPKINIFRDALNRTAVLYPWAMDPDNRKQVPRVDTLWNTSVFNVRITHDQGEINLYLDSSTTNVFREDQARDLDTVNAGTVATNSTASVQLRVNATHETGPLEVSLTRPGTTNPVNGTVYLDGRHVGNTGADGIRWTIDTRGTTRVRVETSGGQVVTAVLPGGAQTN